jgi:hypothetical protein
VFVLISILCSFVCLSYWVPLTAGIGVPRQSSSAPHGGAGAGDVVKWCASRRTNMRQASDFSPANSTAPVTAASWCPRSGCPFLIIHTCRAAARGMQRSVILCERVCMGRHVSTRDGKSMHCAWVSATARAEHCASFVRPTFRHS